MTFKKRKEKVIKAILELEDEHTLTDIEEILKEEAEYRKAGPFDASEIFGILTDEEAEKMKRDIDYYCNGGFEYGIAVPRTR